MPVYWDYFPEKILNIESIKNKMKETGAAWFDICFAIKDGEETRKLCAWVGSGSGSPAPAMSITSCIAMANVLGCSVEDITTGDKY